MKLSHQYLTERMPKQSRKTLQTRYHHFHLSVLLIKMKLLPTSLTIFSYALSVAGQIYKDGDHWRQDSYFLKVTS